MNKKYHIEITKKALKDHFSPAALKMIIHGNIRQDRIKNQFNHDYIHFDSNEFNTGFGYIRNQQKIVISAIEGLEFTTARKAFGRICHSWQDFYSHSNYVKLWLDKAETTSPRDIDPNDQNIISHPKLRSGINYGIVEFFALVPGLGALIKPNMPDDSHAIMNLDSPKAGPLFAFAVVAAMKKTLIAYFDLILKLTTTHIDEIKIAGFKGHNNFK